MREACVCLGTTWKSLGGKGHVRRYSERRKLPLELQDERSCRDQRSVVRRVGNVKEIHISPFTFHLRWGGLGDCGRATSVTSSLADQTFSPASQIRAFLICL